MPTPEQISPQVAVAGEALIDLIAGMDGRYQACLGGAPYNLARALAAQAITTAYLNPLSTDRLGQALQSALLESGAQIPSAQALRQPTSLAVVQLDSSGHPSYAFYREGVADRSITATELIAQTQDLQNLRTVCTGGLALDARDQAIYLPWLMACKDRGLQLVIDANLRPSVMPDLMAYRGAVMSALKLADLVKISDEDLMHLGLLDPDSGQDHTPVSRALAAAKALHQSLDIPLLALTLGAHGACLMTRDTSVLGREADDLTVADTVGAGDSFLAGLLVVLLEASGAWSDLNTHDLTAALSHGLANASLVVQQPGFHAPTRIEAQAWRQQHPLTLTR